MIYHGIYLLVPSVPVAVLACNLSCIREVIRLHSNISWAAPAGLPLIYGREHPARHDPLSLPDSECPPTISTFEVVQATIGYLIGAASATPRRSMDQAVLWLVQVMKTAERFSTASSTPCTH